MEVPRFVGEVSLGLLEKLKEAEDSLVKILPRSEAVFEVDPVEVLMNVAHDYVAESTAEVVAVNGCRVSGAKRGLRGSIRLAQWPARPEG